MFLCLIARDLLDNSFNCDNTGSYLYTFDSILSSLPILNYLLIKKNHVIFSLEVIQNPSLHMTGYGKSRLIDGDKQFHTLTAFS